MSGRSIATIVRRIRRLQDLIGSPRRLIAYVTLYLGYIGRWSIVPATPVNVDIEPINSCNFRCQHCQVTHWKKSKAQLDVGAFQRIIDRLPYLHKVNLQGMGEPLLNKQFIDLLEEGERRGLRMRFHSNASACTEANAYRLLRLKDVEISFSIDGASAEIFERMRPGSKFLQICRNIGFLTAQRGRKKRPGISGWTVLTTENIKELPDIVRLCIKLGLDRVTLQPFLTTWGKDDLSDYAAIIGVEDVKRTYPQLLQEATTIASDARMELNFAISGYSRSAPCPWPWQRTYIAANGDVVPCCTIADSAVVKMGNVFDSPFTEIWNGEAYQELRTRLRTHDLPSYCRACYIDAPPNETDVRLPLDHSGEGT